VILPWETEELEENPGPVPQIPYGLTLGSRRRLCGDVCRTAAIQERVTAVLLSIPKEASADSFQKIYERCQPCVVKDDYFEGQ
jgi:hypothetical protein